MAKKDWQVVTKTFICLKLISSLDFHPNYPTVPSKVIDNLWNYPRDNQRPNENAKKICWQLSLKFGNTKLFRVPPHANIYALTDQLSCGIFNSLSVSVPHEIFTKS